MDEPFSALDVVTRQQLYQLATTLLAEKTVLLVTHDPQEALQLCDDILCCKQTDRVVLSQKISAVVHSPHNRNFGSYTNSYSLFAGGILMYSLSSLLKTALLCLFLLALWQGAILVWDLPHYLLPTPSDVFQQLRHQLLWQHTMVTLLEIFLGLFLALFSACFPPFCSISNRIATFKPLPISQAIPVFAIAPLLVLWLGYGLASKVAMTILIIYFPVTAACYDGLRNTPEIWLESGTNHANYSLQMLFKVCSPGSITCALHPVYADSCFHCTDFAPSANGSAQTKV